MLHLKLSLHIRIIDILMATKHVHFPFELLHHVISELLEFTIPLLRTPQSVSVSSKTAFKVFKETKDFGKNLYLAQFISLK